MAKLPTHKKINIYKDSHRPFGHLCDLRILVFLLEVTFGHFRFSVSFHEDRQLWALFSLFGHLRGLQILDLCSQSQQASDSLFSPLRWGQSLSPSTKTLLSASDFRSLSTNTIRGLPSYLGHLRWSSSENTVLASPSQAFCGGSRFSISLQEYICSIVSFLASLSLFSHFQ